VIRVQLPKPAVEDVEMLVREVLPHHVDVVLVAYLMESLHQIRQLEVAPRNLVIIIGVDDEEYSHDHGVCVAILELGSGLQEFKAGMGLQQILEQRLKIVGHDMPLVFLRQQIEHPPLDLRRLALPLVVAHDRLLRYLLCLHFLHLFYALKQHLLEYFGDLHHLCTYFLEVVQTDSLIRFTFEGFLDGGFSLLLFLFRRWPPVGKIKLLNGVAWLRYQRSQLLFLVVLTLRCGQVRRLAYVLLLLLTFTFLLFLWIMNLFL